MKHIVLLLILSGSFIRCQSGTTDPVYDDKNSVEFWDLATGSHIAYIHIPAADTMNAIPLIFLHGGPGACQVNSFGKEAPAGWYHQLASKNFDVYIYDQVGSGLSERLDNPAEYTVKRHVQDLENIRIIVGNKPCILVGDSWGATLACHYMAAYPQHVIKAIFTSPGSIDIREWNDEYSQVPRFLSGWYEWIGRQYGDARVRRYYRLDELMQTDIQQAYAFAGDQEMDQLADDFITTEILKTCVYHKTFTHSREFRMEGMGWWASAMTIYDLMNIAPVKETLSKNTTPVLVLRGKADYLQEGIAKQYTTVFSNSKLVRIRKAGHFIWLDQPKRYQREIEKFLF